MLNLKKDTGSLGEELASEFLKTKGFVILSRNYRKPWGEIDIIAEKDNQVRFIEVKTVSRERDGGEDSLISREMDHRPEEMVDHRKLDRLARTATLYMEESGDAREYQIDVVGVILYREEKIARCRLFEQVL